jgi:hypothetical protein
VFSRDSDGKLIYKVLKHHGILDLTLPPWQMSVGVLKVSEDRHHHSDFTLSSRYGDVSILAAAADGTQKAQNSNRTFPPPSTGNRNWKETRARTYGRAYVSSLPCESASHKSMCDFCATGLICDLTSATLKLCPNRDEAHHTQLQTS